MTATTEEGIQPMYIFHPVANLFPLIEGEEFQSLVTDIATHGQREPIYLLDNQVLDGRNRLRACQAIGIVPETRQYSGATDTTSLIHFVLSLNLQRRHLTSSQRACIAVEMLPMLETAAKERQIALAGTRPNKDDTLVNDLTKVGKSAEQAATITNTNRQYVSDAKKLAVRAPDLLERVRQGEYSIPEAIKLLDNPNLSDDDEYDGDEWSTPAEWIETARQFLGTIDLDPATNDEAQKIVQATDWYTKADNGLLQSWHGNVWCNPPYSTGSIAPFVRKAIEEYTKGHMTEGLFLTNDNTDTEWFIKLVSQYPVMFSRGRIKFWHPELEKKMQTRQGQAIFYFGKRVGAFFDAFDKLAYVPNRRTKYDNH